MNQRIKTIGAFVAGAVLATGGTALAGHGGPHGGWSHFKLLSALDLTPEQQAVASELRQAAKADFMAAREGREAAMTQALAQLEQANPDASVLHGIIDDSMAEARQNAHARLDDFLSLHATLSPEQRASLVDGLVEMRSSHESRRDEMRERMKQRDDSERPVREGRGSKRR